MFEAPTVAQLAPRIGEGRGCGSQPLVPCERPAVIPLSFAQNRLWFIDQLQGPSPVYNMAAALRLTGALDVEALGAALADVVARHESLRTCSRHRTAHPGRSSCPPRHADLRMGRRRCERMVRRPACSEALEVAARDTFDLATDIPLRARVFRVADDEHVLVAVVHHIAADGWSLRPLVADLGAAYASRCAGQAPDWAPLPVQYVDYTLWQRAQFGRLDESDSRDRRPARLLGAGARRACPSGSSCPPTGPTR